jgi:hypothetical protein
LTISNHKVKNYTGRPIYLTRNLDGNFYKILSDEQPYDIEYIDYNREKAKNYLFLYLEDHLKGDIFINNSNVINMDSNGIQLHRIDFANLCKPNAIYLSGNQKPFQYLISEVSCSGVRRTITLYSPLIFHNKTNTDLVLTIYLNNEENLIILSANKKTGIPFEYFNGLFNITNPLGNKSQTIHFRTILDNTEFNQELMIFNYYYSLSRRIDKSLINVREIKITNPYTIINCLPVDLFIEVPYRTDPIKLSHNEKAYIDTLSINDDLVVRLTCLTFSSNNFIVIYEASKHNDYDSDTEKVKHFNLFLGGNPKERFLTLSFQIVKNTLSHRELVIFSSVIFNNESKFFNMRIFYDNKTEVLARENDILLFNNTGYNKFYLDLNGAHSSNLELNPEDIIKIRCKDKVRTYDFVLTTTLVNICAKYELYATLYKIRPSIIVHNKLEMGLVIKSSETNMQTVSSTSSSPFYINYKDNLLTIKPIDYLGDEEVYKWWSPNFSIQHLGIITVPIVKSSNNNNFEKYYVNIDIKQDNLITDIFIYPANFNNSQFVIENRLSDFVVKVKQEKYEKNNYDFIDYREQNLSNPRSHSNKIIFSLFNYTQGDNIIVLEVTDRYNNNVNTRLRYQIFEENCINLTNGTKKDYPYIHNIKLSNREIYISINSNGMKKTITFCDSSDNHLFTNYENIDQLSIEFSISSMGISLISDNRYNDKKLRNYRRSELLFMCLDNIYGTYTKNTKHIHSDGVLSLVINDIQIDNQYIYLCRYPTIIKTDRRDKNPFFKLNLFSQIHNEDKISKIRYLNFSIKPIIFKAEPALLDALIEAFNNVTSQLDTYYFETLSDIIASKYNIYNRDFNINYKHIYFYSILETSPLNLIMSFNPTGLNTFINKHLHLWSLVRGMIKILLNNPKTKISLDSQNIANFYGSVNETIFKIIGLYKHNLFNKIFGLGIKGIAMAFINLFVKDKDIDYNKVVQKRIRYPRAFYGKYKYIQEYSHSDANMLFTIKTRNVMLYTDEINFYAFESFKDSRNEPYVLLFTNTTIIIISQKNLAIVDMIEYIFIANVTIDEKTNTVTILFNQQIENVF